MKPTKLATKVPTSADKRHPVMHAIAQPSCPAISFSSFGSILEEALIRVIKIPSFTIAPLLPFPRQ